jgi:hypothetical protein
MCTPYVLAASSMMSTLAGIKAQNKGLTSQAAQMGAMAQRQTASDIALLQTRGFQEGARITLEQVRRFRQGVRERGTLASRLGDSGVAGGTTLRDAVASVIQEEMDVGTLETSKDWATQQNILEQRAAVYRGQSTVNQAQGMLDQRTTTGPGMLQLISAGVSGYSQGKMLEPMFSGRAGGPTVQRAGEPGVDAQGFWV